MHYLLSLSLIYTLLSVAVSAHMEMVKPPCIRLDLNPNTISPPDYDLKSPLLSDGSNFPCHGYISLFNTSEGTSVESWGAGTTQYFVINGTATHNGGSCQASISEDNGLTFKVVKTFIGGCPASGKQYTFTVPQEARSGKVIFAWTWFSHTSARPEMYMNCAAVTIRSTDNAPGLSRYPDIFEANIANGCSTPEGDADIPYPGSDVEVASSASLVQPIGGSACSPTVTALSTFDSSATATFTSRNITTGTAIIFTSRVTSNPTQTKLTVPQKPGNTSGTTQASAANISSAPGNILGQIFLTVLLILFSVFSGLFILDHR